MQNYVSFIVDRQVEGLYPRAEELIRVLKTGRHATHRPERTLIMDLQLRSRMNMLPAAEFASGIAELISSFRQSQKTRQRFRDLIMFLRESGDLDSVRSVAHKFAQSVTSLDDQYYAIRGAADLLAGSSSEEDESEAMEVYRYLREHGVVYERASWMHNFATLLFSHDYDDEAGRVWFEAYSLDRASSAIRRSYSQYLLRAGRPDLAERVSNGDPIEEAVFSSNARPLPTRFSDRDAWWRPVLDAREVTPNQPDSVLADTLDSGLIPAPQSVDE